MHHPGFLSRLLACLFGLAVFAASAHEGHDDAPAAPASAAPRFTAVSEQFELVGVIDGRRLSLYLDHAADNSPVQGAKLALEVGGKPLAVTQVADGQYQAELAQPLADGETPVTATVIAGTDSDLLAADIDWHAPAQATPTPAWRRKSLWAGIGAGLLALAALWAGRSRRAASLRTGGAT